MRLLLLLCWPWAVIAVAYDPALPLAVLAEARALLASLPLR
jgi:hypothetical protein